MQKHPYTYIRFNTPVSQEDIRGFRGIILNLFPDNVLFHNHQEDKLLYVYPRIQYKSIDGKACVIGIDDGAKALESLPGLFPRTCLLGKRKVEMTVESVQTEDVELGVTNCTDEEQSYRYYQLKDWLPLSQKNYHRYRHELRLKERVRLLEDILTGHLISFSKGVEYYIKNDLKCDIIAANHFRTFPYKGVNLGSMDLTFRVNMVLPPYIGLGKAASIGHGVILPISETNIYECTDPFPLGRQ